MSLKNHLLFTISLARCLKKPVQVKLTFPSARPKMMFCCSGGHIKQVTGLYDCQKDSLKFKVTFLVSFNNKVLLLVGRKHSHHYTFPTCWTCSHLCGFWNGHLQDCRQVNDEFPTLLQTKFAQWSLLEDK